MTARILLLALSLLLSWVTTASADVTWEEDLERAKLRAAQSGRLVLVHFWAPWCQPCMRLEKTVFAKPEVAEALEKQFVAVKVNVDKNPQLAGALGASSIPCDVVLTPQGKALAKTVSPGTAENYIAAITQMAESGAKGAGPQVASAPIAAPAVPTGAPPMASGGVPADSVAARSPSPAQPPTAVAADDPLARSAWGQGAGVPAARPQPQPFAPAYGQQLIDGTPSWSAGGAGGADASPPAQGTAGPPGDDVPWYERQNHLAERNQYGPEPAATTAWPGGGAAAANAPGRSTANEPNANGPSLNAPVAVGPSLGQAPAWPLADGASLADAQRPSAPKLGDPTGSVASTPGSAAGASGSPWAGAYIPPTAAPRSGDAPSGPTPPGPQTYGPQLGGAAAPSNVSQYHAAVGSQPPAGGETSPRATQQVPTGVPAGSPPLGFGGYCVVSMLEGRQWVKGNPQFGIIHRDRTYLFVSEEARRRFWGDPDRFAPVMSGHDVVLLVEGGRQVPGSHQLGVFYIEKDPQGRPLQTHLYLFANEDSLKRFEAQPQTYVQRIRQAQRQNPSQR